MTVLPSRTGPSPPETDRSPVGEDLFRSIFDHSLEAMLITEPDRGDVIEANPEACRLFGATLTEMRSMSRAEIVDLSDHRALAALPKRGDTGRFVGAMTMRRRDGSTFEADVLATLFTDARGQLRSCMMVRDITQRELAAKALMANEHRYRSLVETTGTVLIGITQDGMIFEWNQEAQRVYGYARREVLGRNYFELFVPAAAQDLVGRDVAKVMLGDPTHNFEYTVINRDGRERRLLWNVTRLLDAAGQPVGVLASGQDISERIHAEETLRNVVALVENSRDFVGYADISGNALYLNPAGRQLVGVTEVAGISIDDFIHEDTRYEFRSSVLPVLMDVGSWTGETQLRHFVTREQIDVEVTAFLVRDAKGEAPRYIAAVARDIRDRKRLEAERRLLEEKVRHAQKLESLGVLAGGIAHDFNNLLVGILGNASLALMDLNQGTPLYEVVHDIETTARRAADLTKQMLAYSGRGRFVVRPVNLSSVVEEMAHLLQTVISKGAVLRFDFAADLPPVDADETQIRQIVMNLITNASDAIGTRSGFIMLRTGAVYCDRDYLRTVYIDDELPEGQYVYVEVSDTGEGMTDETMAKMFDPFFSTKFTGRGLGLSATLGIVRGHRGTVKVASEQGVGTTFRVLLPSSTAALSPAPPAEPTMRAHGGGTILVVDDDETVRSVARTMLERRGFRVMLANDGRHALELFRDAHPQIALVLLDLTMPHLGGEEAFRALREIKPDIRVILMSGYSGHELSQRFASSGLAGFIQKPFRIDDVDATLARVLASSAEGPDLPTAPAS